MPNLGSRSRVSERNIAHKLWTEILEGVLLKDFGVMQSLRFWKGQVWGFVEVGILVRQLGDFTTLHASGHAVTDSVSPRNQLSGRDFATTEGAGGRLKVLLNIVNELLTRATGRAAV